ncbi:MAG TPA: hypothetical protein VMX17_03890 [Candidatus Glassbacteria bacterium]|nr:hypothetical protein [Candidatus Glassbacteria bacterium]
MFPRYSVFSIKKKAQEVEVGTEMTEQPNYGQTTITNPALLENNLNALEGVNMGPDTTKKNNHNKFIRYLKDLIQKRDNPSAQVAMNPPSIKEVWNILAVPKGTPGVEPNVIVSIFENVKPHFITGDHLQKLKELQRISP